MFEIGSRIDFLVGGQTWVCESHEVRGGLHLESCVRLLAEIMSRALPSLTHPQVVFCLILTESSPACVVLTTRRVAMV